MPYTSNCHHIVAPIFLYWNISILPFCFHNNRMSKIFIIPIKMPEKNWQTTLHQSSIDTDELCWSSESKMFILSTKSINLHLFERFSANIFINITNQFWECSGRALLVQCLNVIFASLEIWSSRAFLPAPLWLPDPLWRRSTYRDEWIASTSRK